MANERNPATDDEATNRRKPVDQPTSAVGPFGDADADATDGSGAASADATTAMPAADATTAIPTTAAQRVTPQIWAARVPIRPDDAPSVREAAPAEWPEGDQAGPPRGDRFWLRPTLITVAVVVMLAMLSTGLWLIFNRQDHQATPAPGTSPTATPSAEPTTETQTPTTDPTPTEDPAPTAAETTAAAQPPPPVAPTTAAQVPVPDVIGQTEAAARQHLIAKGFAVKVTTQVAPGTKAGRVISTDPGAGSLADKGTQVTVVVAKSLAPSATASSSLAANASPAA